MVQFQIAEVIISELPVCQHSCIIFQWTQLFLFTALGTLYPFLVSGL